MSCGEVYYPIIHVALELFMTIILEEEYLPKVFIF